MQNLVRGRLKRKFDELISEDSQWLDSFFITLSYFSLDFLFLCQFRLFIGCLIILKNSWHTMLITTLVIDQDEAIFAFPANITEHILTTSMDINIALTLEKMIMRDTLQTWFSVRGILGTCSNVLLSCLACPSEANWCFSCN